VARIALRGCTCLTSPQVGECTSKFVIEGACASRGPCPIYVENSFFVYFRTFLNALKEAENVRLKDQAIIYRNN